MADEDFFDANHASDDSDSDTRARHKKHANGHRRRRSDMAEHYDDSMPTELTVDEFKAQIDSTFSAGVFERIVTDDGERPKTLRLQVSQCVSNPVCQLTLNDGRFEVEARCREAVSALRMPAVNSLVDVRGLQYSPDTHTWSLLSFNTVRDARTEVLPLAGTGVRPFIYLKPSASNGAPPSHTKRRIGSGDDAPPETSAPKRAPSMMGPPSATAATPAVSSRLNLTVVADDLRDNRTLPAAFLRFQKDVRSPASDDGSKSPPCSQVPKQPDAKLEYLYALPRAPMPPALTHCELSALADGLPAGQTYVGPVCIDSITPAPAGTKRPTRVLVSDIDGVPLEYITWSAADDVATKFDVGMVCWIGRGIIEKARTGPDGRRYGVSDFTVKFSVGDGVRNTNELLIVEPLKGVYAKRFGELRSAPTAAAAAAVIPSGLQPATAASGNRPLSISVTELVALRDNTSAQQDTTNIAVHGLLVRVSTKQMYRSGKGFYRRVTLEDQLNSVQFNVFSSAAQFHARLAEWCGGEDTDFEETAWTAPHTVVVYPMTVSPQAQYKLNLGYNATIEELATPNAELAAAAQSRANTAAQLPTLTLAQAHAQPAHTRFVCYVVAPYCADARDGFSRNREPMRRWPVSVMDDSVAPGRIGTGRFCTHTVRFLERSAAAARVRASGPEQRPAFDASPTATGTVMCSPPENIVVLKLRNYFFSQSDAAASSSSSAGSRLFEPTKYLSADRESSETINPPNDARADELRQWYIAEGHRHFVPSVQPEYNGEQYRQGRAAYDARAASNSIISVAGAPAPVPVSPAKPPPTREELEKIARDEKEDLDLYALLEG
jgi:hypothetical protein